MSDEQKWYYLDEHKNKIGPYPQEKFVELFHSSGLSPQTLIWSSGMEAWSPYSEIDMAIYEPEARPDVEVRTGLPGIINTIAWLNLCTGMVSLILAVGGSTFLVSPSDIGFFAVYGISAVISTPFILGFGDIILNLRHLAHFAKRKA